MAKTRERTGEKMSTLQPVGRPIPTTASVGSVADESATAVDSDSADVTPLRTEGSGCEGSPVQKACPLCACKGPAQRRMRWNARVRAQVASRRGRFMPCWCGCHSAGGAR